MHIKRHKNYDPFRRCMHVCMYLKTLCMSRQNGTNPPPHSHDSPSITTYTLLQRDSYAMYSYNIYNRSRLYPVLHPSSLIPRPSQKRGETHGTGPAALHLISHTHSIVVHNEPRPHPAELHIIAFQFWVWFTGIIVLRLQFPSLI